MLARIGIRLVAVYVVVKLAPALLGFGTIWAMLVGWVGAEILQLPAASEWVRAGGSGSDSTFEYVTLGCALALTSKAESRIEVLNRPVILIPAMAACL